MKEIRLTKGCIALVDDCDYERTSQFEWHATECFRSDRSLRNVYAARSIRKPDGSQTTQDLHRFIMGMTDKKIEVNHDHNGLNCQRFNLRLATRTNSMQNRRKQFGSSQFKGVTWRKRYKVWCAQIGIDGHRFHLGSFASEEQAALAYDAAARTHFGEFAVLNFPARQERPACPSKRSAVMPPAKPSCGESMP